MMMMVSNGFNFPPNGYYNPQPPRRQQPQSLETRETLAKAGANDEAAFYASSINTFDKPQFGGNGDGRLDRREIEIQKRALYNSFMLSQNNYQQTGDVSYRIQGDLHYQNLRVMTNLEQNFSVFAQADPSGNGQITAQGIYNVAARDGDPTRLTAQDVNPTMMPYGGMQPQYNPMPMPYGGGQPMYNNAPPMMMPNGYPMQAAFPPPMSRGYDPNITLQHIAQARTELAGTTKKMLGLLYDLDPKSPTVTALKERLFTMQDIDQKLDYQSQIAARQMGYNPAQLRAPGQVFAADLILPSIELDVLKPQADNPDKWDAKKLAQDVQARIAQLDRNGDGQLSFQEGVNARNGLLGNGVLRMPTGKGGASVWAALAGADGKMNARELAAALVSVDYDSNGTVSSLENKDFMNNLANGAFIAPSTVVGRYNDIDLKAQRIGLDAYLPKTRETAYAKQLEDHWKGATKEQIKSGLAVSSENIEALKAKYNAMNPKKTPEAQQLGLIIATAVDVRADLRRFQGNNWLSEQFPLDSTEGIAPSAEKYAKEFDAKYTELTKKLATLDPASAEGKQLKSALAGMKPSYEYLQNKKQMYDAYWSSNPAAEKQMGTVQAIIHSNEVADLIKSDPVVYENIKAQQDPFLNAYQYLPKPDLSKLSEAGKRLFALGDEIVATSIQLRAGDNKSGTIQKKLNALQKQYQDLALTV
jgi:hypothetical protein